MAEQDSLWQRRRLVTEALRAAAAEGDRSENAEYIYRKKELREIDRRIRYLQKRIPELIAVPPRHSGNKVHFGATVGLWSEKGERRVTLVGADEIDASGRYISIDSPLARVLIGKEVDDAVTISVDGRRIDYEITDIRYSSGAIDPTTDGDDPAASTD